MQMKSANDPDIICRLKKIRIRKKLTQAGLAGLVGIKRQAVYDLEAGRYLPNTLVALRLARVLQCRVEDIFVEKSRETGAAVLVAEAKEAGSRVTLAKIRGRLYAYPLSGYHAVEEEMKAADGLLEPGTNQVTMLRSHEELDSMALIMGCDPALSILGHHVRKTGAGAALYCRFASSQKALNRLAGGVTHMAGTHMHSEKSRDGNLDLVRRTMGGQRGLLVGFSRFEEGLMVARGNPLGIRNPGDLAQDGVRFVNREKGAALRALLDECLETSGIAVSCISGYDDLVSTHFQGARKILYGTCDAALGLRAVADICHLDFVPISQVRCDLVIPGDLLDHPGVKIVLDILQTREFRDELNSLPGYEASIAGNVIAEF